MFDKKIYTRAGFKHALIFLQTCILFLALASCSKIPDEEKIKKIIDAMSTAVETNQPAAIAQYLHDDFRANGDMDAQQIKQMLVMIGMQHQSISITVVSVKTVIDPIYRDKALSTLSVLMTGSSGGLLPTDGSARVVTLEWRKDGDWKILKANWQE